MGAVDEVRDLVEAVARRRSLTLWDVEVGGQEGRTLLRVFVDAPGGIDLASVAEVSEEISRALDLRDPIGGRYVLEVSSPGLERPLRSPRHFDLSRGEQVVIKTRNQLVSNSHRLEGVIADAGDDAVTVATNEEQIEVPYEEIKSARTVFQWQ